MTTPAWFIQIFEMPDVDARNVAADLVARIDGVSVAVKDCGPDRLLVVEVRGEEQASTVSRMVFASDPRSIPLHTAVGPPAPELAAYIFERDEAARHAMADELDRV
jgi:hypothetical protein